ncbi:MAG TPA: peptide deformylase [Bryobacteraceae bacterium]|jgi:peptide deformylase|nr:peptide deformylase [Bryobacteraceae bacterium]
MPARRILQLGDPLLRAVSSPLSDYTTAGRIFRDLRDTLHEFRRTHGFGRGISAVQIGEPTRLIYIEMEGVEYAMVNPRLVSRSAETFRLWDDCFSFPHLLVYLERARSVLVAYRDQAGEDRHLDVSGAFSELLQHELDHLDGVLAVDRAIDGFSLCTREEYERRYRGAPARENLQPKTGPAHRKL